MADFAPAVAELVTASRRVLDMFRSGTAPSFDHLDRLDAALFPFENDKLCGHPILEDCDCFEMMHADTL